MVNKFVLIIFFGLNSPEKTIDHIVFPWRAECDYAAEKINEEMPDAKAFCFDMQVAGDRHENSRG